MAAEFARRWQLKTGPPFELGGGSAWVGPAAMDSGQDVVLKVAWRHREADHEADGLRAWGGDGAVRILRHEQSDDTAAFLLERCDPGTPLSGQDEMQQDVVIAGLLQRLWIEPPDGHRLRPLREMCDTWAEQAERRHAESPVMLDPGLIRSGLELFRELPATVERNVMLCTDLHAGNVLRARREPWLVIDPKPHVGDPTYDVLQHMLNCEHRLRRDPHGFVLRMADLCRLDAARLRLWLFARCVQQSPGWMFPLEDVARRLAPG